MWYSDKKLLAPYLDLEKDGYFVYLISLNSLNQETKTWTEEIREIYKTYLTSAGYEGFSNDIDNEYHSVGTYFFVVKDNAIVLTSRINDRTNSSRFPFEMGQRPNGEHYVFQDKIPAVDISAYTVILRHYRRAMPLLSAVLGKYINDLGAKKAFCLVDCENKVIQRMYHDIGFVYSTTFSEPITFPSFLNALTRKPVEWKIMEWDEQTIKYYCELHSNQPLYSHEKGQKS